MKSVKAIVALAVIVGAWSATSPSAQAQGERARVTRVTQLHNQFQDGQRGMIIQMDLEIDGCRDRAVNVAAYFQWKDGKKLIALPGKYQAPDGQFSVQRKIVPNYLASDFKNVELFVPYSEMTLSLPGSYDLRFFIEVQYHNGVNWGLLHVGLPYNFNVKQK